jgi:hypothetical protein
VKLVRSDRPAVNPLVQILPGARREARSGGRRLRRSRRPEARCAGRRGCAVSRCNSTRYDSGSLHKCGEVAGGREIPPGSRLPYRLTSRSLNSGNSLPPCRRTGWAGKDGAGFALPRL